MSKVFYKLTRFIRLFYYRSANGATVTCSAFLESGKFSLNLKKFDSHMGWTRTYRDCTEPIGECPKLTDTFSERTNKFDLNTKNDRGKTLAELFCQENPHVPKTRLQLNLSYSCFGISETDVSSSTAALPPKQEIECVNGKATMTEISSSSNLGWIISIVVGVVVLCLIVLSVVIIRYKRRLR